MSVGQNVFIAGEIIGVMASIWLTTVWLTDAAAHMNWKENLLAAVICLFPWAYMPWLVYGIWWLCSFTYNTILHLPYCA